MAKILIVDDDPAIRDMLTELFRRHGYTVAEAADGIAALRIVRTGDIDLVVTDIIMPEKEGIEVINEIWRDYPGMKIIAISGGGRIKARHYLETAEFFGAHRIFEKPLDPTRLLRAAEELLRRNGPEPRGA